MKKKLMNKYLFIQSIDRLAKIILADVERFRFVSRERVGHFDYSVKWKGEKLSS